MNKGTSYDLIDGYVFEKRVEMRHPFKTSLNRLTPKRPKVPTTVDYLDDIEIDYATGLGLEQQVLDFLYPEYPSLQASALAEFHRLISTL